MILTCVGKFYHEKPNQLNYQFAKNMLHQGRGKYKAFDSHTFFSPFYFFYLLLVRIFRLILILNFVPRYAFLV